MNIDYFDAGCLLLVVFWLGRRRRPELAEALSRAEGAVEGENRGHKKDSITNSKAKRTVSVLSSQPLIQFPHKTVTAMLSSFPLAINVSPGQNQIQKASCRLIAGLLDQPFALLAQVLR